MNQTAMRITASLPLWYLLSTMSGKGPGTSHNPPHSHPVDVLLPVKYDFLVCPIQRCDGPF